MFGNLASGQNSVLTLWRDFANVVSLLPPGVLMSLTSARPVTCLKPRSKAVASGRLCLTHREKCILCHHPMHTCPRTGGRKSRLSVYI